MTTKTTLKIKHHGLNPISFIAMQSVGFTQPIIFSIVVDTRLDDIFNHFKTKTTKSVAGISDKYVVIYQNRRIKILTDSQEKSEHIQEKPDHIFIDIDDNDINFINEKIKNSDKINKAHKDGEFEITTREEEIEL